MMAKRLQQHPIQYEKDPAGCIWGFISILDFRPGRSTSSLLENRRSSSRQIVGAGYSRSKLHKLTNPNEASQQIYDGEGRDTLLADVAKTSVKELMEEEMLSEQEQKQQMSSADIQVKEIDLVHGGRVKKNPKRTSKTSKSSCDFHCKLEAGEKYGPENSCLQDSEGKTNPGMEVVVNELCQQIFLKSSSMKHDCNSGLAIQSEQAFSVFDEKLIEAIKVFVDQRLIHGKHLTEDEKFERATECNDALQTISSNKELILKLLKDPNSLLVKHIEDLEVAELEKDQSSNSLARYNLSDGKLKISKASEPVARKQHNFFRRKSKSREKFPLKGHENCQTSRRIVILKPSESVQIYEPEAKFSSSKRSHPRLGTKVQTQRITSQFSFTEITRKLKHAMGKERHGVLSDDRVAYEPQNSGNRDKGTVREKVGWNSPKRNHYYDEKFARLAIVIKNKDKSFKPKDTETSIGNDTVENPSNNLYVDAKKHLSEMLSDGDQIEDFSSSQLPKTIGRILSLPDFNLSPDFVTAQKRFSQGNSFHMVDEDSWELKQDSDVSHLGPSMQDLNSHSSLTDNPENTLRSSNSDVLDEFNRANAVEETSCSMRPEKSYEGDVHVIEITDASVDEESHLLDISIELCSPLVIREDKIDDLSEVCDEEEYAQSLKSGSYEKDQLLSSPSESPPSSPIIKHVGDQHSANERAERPSPVSVLEPLFTDDEISPTMIKSQPVERPMQPRQIIFDERFSSETHQEIFVRACMEDEESAFDYVEAVLLASDLNWEEFLSRWISSDQILDSSLFDEVELFSNRSRDDQKLLFDCTNEILKEVCECYFGYSPWVSFVKHNIRAIPRAEHLIHEVWDGVEWYLLSQPSPSTLDQIVGKDMAKTGTWMDLRFDVAGTGIEIGEAIFEELVDETISSFINEGPEMDSSMLLEVLVEVE